MRILHVLSQTQLTGAEVYATSVAKCQLEAGHEVTLVSDKLHVPTDAAVLYQAISKRSWPNRIKNILFLKKIIREHKIDVVHAHSRASSWVSYWATKWTKTAYVSTIHGRQHLHLSLKYYDVYGDRVIAICNNIREHLSNEAGLQEKKIFTIPNGFDFGSNDFIKDRAPIRRDICFIGRTSGPKGACTAKIIKNILPQLLEQFSDLVVTLAGGPLSNYDLETIATINELKKKYSSRFRAYEHISRELVHQLIAQSSLVVGSGRLAIRALSLSRAVLGLGEAGCHGLITEENIRDAMDSNFGDISAFKGSEIDFDFFHTEVNRFLQSPTGPSQDLSDQIKSKYNLLSVYQKIDSVYFEALLERRVPKRIPVLMYHKVVEAGYESPHKTYISSEGFESHLKTLKARGFEGVTFKDIQEAALCGSSLPKKPIVLTFDDGYSSVLGRALPLLVKYGFRSVFYLLGNANAKENTWDAPDAEGKLISIVEAKQLVEAGMEIGAHSVTHRKLPELPDSEIRTEVLTSKKFLEKELQKEIISFAYPYGTLCDRSKEAVRDLGFRFAVATDSGSLTFAGDPFQVFRASIFPQDGPMQIRKKASRFYRVYYFLKRGK